MVRTSKLEVFREFIPNTFDGISVPTSDNVGSKQAHYFNLLDMYFVVVAACYRQRYEQVIVAM